MQSLQFSQRGDLESLQLCDLPIPALDDGDVLVEVHAAGLNPSDVKNVLGLFPYTTTPRIPGRDFAGVVVQGPSELMGQAVWGGTGKGFGFTRDGCHARYVAVPAAAIARKPDALSFAQAATCGVPYITALSALESTRVEAGTRLLVIGAGAVGQAALALAKSQGAEVAVAARRDDAVAALRTAGATAFRFATAAQLAAEARQCLGEPPEVIFDTTGHWLPAAIGALGTFGRIAVIAAPPGGQVDAPVLDLYRQGGAIVGINSLLFRLEECARMLERIGALFDQGVLPLPTGFREVPLAAGVAAYSAVNDGSADKIVLLPA